MDSGSDNHSPSHGNVFRSAQKVRNNYHFTLVACQGLAKHSFTDLIFSFIAAELLE
jgi:hypothetical protein